jgi:hypothetical protein
MAECFSTVGMLHYSYSLFSLDCRHWGGERGRIRVYAQSDSAHTRTVRPEWKALVLDSEGIPRGRAKVD